MDFESLLHVAKKNAQSKKEPAKYLTTKFKPPTKEQRDKDKVLSEGVQRFLARKEEEERRKREEAERQKEELLALRAKDPKAQKRIQTMLKRTKSANKSVMEDAVDNNNTADTLAGPTQPDEDDYGFVSESASAAYNKLMQKMYSSPSTDVPKFAPSKKPNSSNLSNTKERVKAALLKQVEDERLPHKRSRKSKTGEDHNEDSNDLNYSAPDRDVQSSSSSNDKDRHEKPKPKKPPPPPLDFRELLRIAEQKQHEPVVIEPKVKKPPEPEVLMTKKQKLEYEKMQEWKRRRELRLQGLENGDKSSDDKKLGKIPKIGQSSESKSISSTSQKIPKVNKDEPKVNGAKPVPKSSDKIPEKGYSSKGKDLDKPKSKLVPERKNNESDKYKNISEETMRLKKERDEALRLLKEKEQLIKEKEEAARILKEKERLIRERDEAVRKLKEKELLIKERDEAVRKLKMLEKSEKVKTPVKNGIKPSNDKSSGLNYKNSVESIKSNSSRSDVKPGSAKPNLQKDGGKLGVREFPPKDVVRSREFPPRDVVRSREFPPKDLVKSREFPPKDVQRKQFPPRDVKRKPQTLKRRRIDSDEDEYDSELEDFIDDGDPDVQPEDVSKVISEIFKYDKNKYARYADDDDECMESNFAQISKEEFISTKCGLLEDLQDIQREKAMLARKKKR